jgi:hypothetical protein
MILDSHAHCGRTLKFNLIKGEWENAEISGGVLFSPVEEIYNRRDPFFEDSEEYKNSRRNVHLYLQNLVQKEDNLAAFFFGFSILTSGIGSHIPATKTLETKGDFSPCANTLVLLHFQTISDGFSTFFIFSSPE